MSQPIPIDALAVARATLREPSLPITRLDPASREVKLLMDHRDILVRRRTATINQLQWLLHDPHPDWQPSRKALIGLAELDRRQPTRSGLVSTIFAFIKGFYNPRRRCSTCGYLNPADYEAQSAGV